MAPADGDGGGTSSSGEPVVYARHWQRFPVTAVYCLGSAANAVMWICFSPIFQQTQDRFGVGTTAVNMLSLVFLFAYLPASLLTVYLSDRYGLRVAIVVGCALNALCGWLRYAACFVPATADGGSGAYALLLVGQLMGAVAQPFFTNLPARVSADWFPASQRDGATVVASMSNPVGNAIGSVVPALVVTVAGDVPGLLLGQAVASTLILVAAWLAVPAAPASPPSAAAAKRSAVRASLQRRRAKQAGISAMGVASNDPLSLGSAPSAQHLLAAQTSPAPGAAAGALDGGSSSGGAGTDDSEMAVHDAWGALREMRDDAAALLSSGQFLLLTTAFSAGLGVFNALMTVLAQLLAPCGYGDDVAGTAGGVLLGAGLLMAGVVGAVLEKTRAYVPVLRVILLASVAALVFALSSLRPGAEAAVIASFALLGGALVPALPVALENAAECSYPISEDTSSAVLMTGGQLVGIALIFGVGDLLGRPPSSDCSSVATPAAGLMLGLVVVALACIAGFRRNYRRQAAERGDGDGDDAASAANGVEAAPSARGGV